MPFIRTCLKCGTNCYSPAEYSSHMEHMHSKKVPASVVSEPRKVDNSLTKKASLDVPEEILVNPREIKEKKPTKAPSRERRAPQESTPVVETPFDAVPTATGEADSAPAERKPKTKRGRRSTKQKAE